MEETMDGLDDEELEEEADEEVDKVLFELTDGKLGQAGRVGGELPVCDSTAGRGSALPSARQLFRVVSELTARRTRRTRPRTRPRWRACSARCRTS